MERQKEDGTWVMSVCTPDLGITEKGYTTSQPSQPIMKILSLNGLFSLVEENSSVTIIKTGNKTLLEVRCINGQPVEFSLRKD